jgi:hypothetical protein
MLSIIQLIREELEDFYDYDKEQSMADKYYQTKVAVDPSPKGYIYNAELVGNVDKQYGRKLSEPVPIYKNPKNLQGFGNGARGVLLSNGDFYLAQSWEAMHDDLLDLLGEKNIIPYTTVYRYYHNYPEEYIAVQRQGSSNTFAQSTAYDDFPPYYEEIFKIGNQKQPFEFKSYPPDVNLNEIESPLDPNLQVSYMPQGYKHNILDETFQGVQEIKKLTNDIIKKVAEKNYEQYNKDKDFKYIYGVNLSEMDSNQYEEIKNFVKESNLQIYFTPKTEGKRSYADYGHIPIEKGEKFNPKWERDINVFYDYNRLRENIYNLINKDFYNNPREKPIDSGEIYTKFYYEFNNSLIHEIQHAYDDYRSGGMAFNTKEYQDYIKKRYFQIGNTFYQSQINDLKHLKTYLNLPHEIWARFSQAMLRVRFSTFDIEDNNLVYRMYPLNGTIKQFGYEFQGYSTLPDDMKKRLIRKVAQFWHYEQDKVNKLNKEKKVKDTVKSVLKEFISENFDTPIIEITPVEPDYRSGKSEPQIYHVRYEKNVEGELIEIEGSLKPYHTGRAVEYGFEPDYFAEPQNEQYWDENWEAVEDEIRNKFYSQKY